MYICFRLRTEVHIDIRFAHFFCLSQSDVVLYRSFFLTAGQPDGRTDSWTYSWTERLSDY